MQTDKQRLVHTFAALADLGQEIANAADFDEMLQASFHLLLGSLAIRRGALAEYDPKHNLVRFTAARGLAEAFGRDVPLTPGQVARLTEVGASRISLHDVTAQAQELFAASPAITDQSKIELLIPLVVRNQLIGIVLLGEKASGEPFTEEDVEVLCALSRHLAVGIHSHRLLEEVERKADENRQLYDGLRTIYKDTVRAFAAAIDIKDRYTQGHSVRVGKYSEIIARELGWGDEEVEGITIAGYLHDIGKLIVDLSVINSPERFNAKESKEMSRHPAAGYEILAPITHPYADIPLMARYHHERMDGLGYPDGLRGDEIPAGAKIVTLADSFDAMTTDRPYRRRLPLADILTDFRDNTGTQFAPEVVNAFCRAFLREVSGASADQRITKLLGKNYDDLHGLEPLLVTMVTDLDGVSSAATARGH